MYVCVWMCICMSVHVFAYVYLCVHIYECVHVYVRVFKCMCVQAHTSHISLRQKLCLCHLPHCPIHTKCSIDVCYIKHNKYTIIRRNSYFEYRICPFKEVEIKYILSLKQNKTICVLSNTSKIGEKPQIWRKYL